MKFECGCAGRPQPPGRKTRPFTCCQGGEKALTAIALVFAIFQLNPAPFCLLDEVDAPLDDANTERYAKLVTHMSHSTQFYSSATTKLPWKWHASSWVSPCKSRVFRVLLRSICSPP